MNIWHVCLNGIARRPGMRFIHGRMFELSAGGMAFQNDPISSMPLEKVSHLHGGAALL